MKKKIYYRRIVQPQETREIDKGLAREKFLRENPNFFTFTKTDQKALLHRLHMVEKMKRKVEFASLLEKMRVIDGQTLQEIADGVGLSRERVRQILERLSKKNI
jgi:DNA-directed RNA polymerase sigma subunit (sigma70/sigma32)